MLDACGVPRPVAALAVTRAEAEAAAARLGGPLVLKVQSPDLLHKTEYGGVRVGVAPGDAGAVHDVLLSSVAARLPAARLDGVLVCEQVDAGVELLVGLTGPVAGYPAVVTVGFGGIDVELAPDVVSALAPIDAEGALALLRRLRRWPLLDGFRGRPRADASAAATAIARITEVGCRYSAALVELEVNPLIVHEEGAGAHAADVVIRLRPAGMNGSAG